ncbi:cytochrome P450 4C1-like [Anthonomus grandis grandis]|uniref:cytochrome P450 4C1-like n=1 Tax=Anthonomus grandis grandis TaxID=2921223 RepID=UPI0021659254|nr:cytochrome P450 4C1-like [Anthonomus grandis grandis]
MAFELLIPNMEQKITSFFLIFLACTILIWYLQMLWKKRKIYQASLSLPGPLALPIIGSALYFIGARKSYDFFQKLKHLFNSYPGIFRIWLGPQMYYAVSEPKYVDIILTSPAALRKDNLYRFLEPVSGHGLVSALLVSQWKKNRKLINPAFNQQILNSFMVVFVEQAEVFVDILKKYVGKGECDIMKLVSRCTLDIICETAIGVKIQSQSTNSSIAESVERSMEIVLIRILTIYYHSDLVFDHSPIGKEFYDVSKKLRAYTETIIEQKKKQREKEKLENKELFFEEGASLRKKVFLDLLIDINDNCQTKYVQFTDEELLDETMTILIAGSDTTSTTTCYVLMMLAIHQDIQERVFGEILEVVGDEESVQLYHLPNLNYLERIIKETLRLFPIVPFLLRRTEGNIDIGDYTIQKDCPIIINTLHLHRTEKYWPNSLKFDPDRFLPERAAKIVPGSFIPFSYGPRNCIGMKFSIMEMKTILTTVIKRYRLLTSYKSVEEIELDSTLLLRPRDGYKLSFELRN